MSQFITLRCAGTVSNPPRNMAVRASRIIGVSARTSQKHSCAVTVLTEDSDLPHSVKVLEPLPVVVARLNDALAPAPETIIHKEEYPVQDGPIRDFTGEPIRAFASSEGEAYASSEGEAYADSVEVSARSVTCPLHPWERPPWQIRAHWNPIPASRPLKRR